MNEIAEIIKNAYFDQGYQSVIEDLTDVLHGEGKAANAKLGASPDYYEGYEDACRDLIKKVKEKKL